MSITETGRLELHREVSAVMSEKSGDILMRLLPPAGWADVATKHDLAHNAHITHLELRTMSRELRTETIHEFAVLRQEIAIEFVAVRKEMNDGFTAVHQEMHNGFSSLRSELHTQTNRMFLAILATNTLMMSIAIVAFKIL